MSPLQIGELLTAIMIGCFGVSWPFSLRKAIVSKSTKGQSLLFLLLIEIEIFLILKFPMAIQLF